jgi:hypothetical protein
MGSGCYEIGEDIPLNEEDLWWCENRPIKVGSCWQPTTGITGCGIVLKIDEGKDLIEPIYSFVTDFGNICLLTRNEILDHYDFITVDVDPKARFERQRDLLNIVYEELIKNI